MTDLIQQDSNENLRYYVIVVMIYISVFINSYVFFKQPFEFYVGYLVYILLLPGFIRKHGIPYNLLAIFSVFFATGVFNILIGNNTAALFFKVFTGLVLSYFFYYYVIREFDFDLEKLFLWYLKGAYIVALIGIVQFVSFQVGFTPGYDYHWLFNKWGFVSGGTFGIRINSVFSEPTYFASAISAAFFVSLHNLIRKETFGLSRPRSILIVLAYLLSFSGVGYSGVFLCVLLLAISYGLLRNLLLMVPVIIIVFALIYNNVKDFSDRYDSLIGLFSGSTFKLGKTHGSSFILYNNYVVTYENFKSNFAFGSGIGSHPVAFDKYSLAKHFKVTGFNSNSADANSMLLRLLSETGLFGTIIFLYITFKCYVRRDERFDSSHWLISNSILVMILLNLLRQGHYFLLGFPFFFLIYYFNYWSYQNYVQQHSANEAVADAAV